jgi:hypothetical protein
VPAALFWHDAISFRAIDFGASIVFMAFCIKAFCVHFYEDVRRELESRRSLPSIAAAAMPLAVSAQSTSDRRRLPSSYSRASIPANVADNRSELASDTRRQPYRSHGANCASVKNTGIRSWISPANSFGSVMIIVQDFSRSPLARSFH